MKINHMPEKSCFEAVDDCGNSMGRITYYRDGDVLEANHTWTDTAYRGRGVAGRLLDALVEYAAANNLKIRPVCSYVVAAFQKDPARYDGVAE